VTPKEFVLAQFPGRLAIPLLDAGKAIGYSPQSCYNMHHKGTFPLRIHKEGTKPMVALTELIRYLEVKTEVPAANDAAPAAVKKRNGRPSARDLGR
jgi:hypothetical protein